MAVAGDTPKLAVARARWLEEWARRKRGCLPGNVSVPLRNKAGGFCCWLDLQLPPGLDGLGVGRSIF